MVHKPTTVVVPSSSRSGFSARVRRPNTAKNPSEVDLCSPSVRFRAQSCGPIRSATPRPSVQHCPHPPSTPRSAASNATAVSIASTPRSIRDLSEARPEADVPVLAPAMKKLQSEMQNLYTFAEQLQGMCKWLQNKERSLNQRTTLLNGLDRELVQSSMAVEQLVLEKIIVEGQSDGLTFDNPRVQAVNDWIQNKRETITSSLWMAQRPASGRIDSPASTPRGSVTHGLTRDDYNGVLPESYDSLLQRLRNEMTVLQEATEKAHGYELEVVSQQRAAQLFSSTVLQLSNDVLSGVPQLGGYESETVKRYKFESIALRGKLFDCLRDKQRAEERERYAYQIQREADGRAVEKERHAREAHLVQRRLEAQIESLTTERHHLLQRTADLKARTRGLHTRNSELKLVFDRATRRGGIIQLTELLSASEARVDELTAHNAFLQHEFNLEKTESDARLKHAADATTERKDKEEALKQLELAKQGNLLLSRDLFEARDKIEELKQSLTVVETMVSRIHRKQFGDSTLQEVAKNDTRQKMENLMRQVALARNKCESYVRVTEAKNRSLLQALEQLETFQGEYKKLEEETTHKIVRLEHDVDILKKERQFTEESSLSLRQKINPDASPPSSPAKGYSPNQAPAGPLPSTISWLELADVPEEPEKKAGGIKGMEEFMGNLEKDACFRREEMPASGGVFYAPAKVAP